MQKCSVASITLCQSDKYRLTVCVSIFRDPLLDSHSLSLVSDIASLNASSFCEQDDVFLASAGCNASRVPPLLLVLFDRRLDFIFGINIIIVINYLWACILPTCVDQTDQAAQAFFFLSLSIFFPGWLIYPRSTLLCSMPVAKINHNLRLAKSSFYRGKAKLAIILVYQ